MAAYSNYQMPQYGQAPPVQQSPYGQPQPQYSPQQQQQMGMSMGQMPPQMQQQQGQYFPNASAPPAGGRGPLRRSLSMGSAQEIKNQMALVSFDPYASTQAAAAPAGAPPAGAYSNYSLPPAAGGDPFAASAPPAFTTEDMTTSPMAGASQYGFAQPPPPQYAQSYQGQPAYDPTASTVSDISMFSSAPPAAATTSPTSSALVPATETAVTVDPIAEAKAAGVDPKLIAEQEKIYADIQARNKMQEIRKRAGINSSNGTSSRAMVPHHGASHGGAMVPYGQGGRQAPPRTRSMPNTNNRSQDNSLARGGVAVLDPKKDLRKQTRKMKTAGGAVGGAVVGGLILGPVGVVLGAGGGAAVSNKMAKSRDKRKQQEFEQRNFQKGAASSVAAKGDGSFV